MRIADRQGQGGSVRQTALAGLSGLMLALGLMLAQAASAQTAPAQTAPAQTESAQTVTTQTADAAPPLRVLATVGMVADLAARLGADCAEVASLIGPGADPHLFTPRPTDLRRLREADLVVRVGLGLEGRLGEVLDSLGALELGSVVAAPEDLLQEDAGVTDPHLWMDVALWAGIVPPLAEAMASRRPACAADIAARAADLGAALAQLDAWVRASIQTIAPQTRILVTAHDAFGYYGRAYGIEVAALQGISTAAEASIADLSQTAQLIAARAIPAVFVETTINPRSIEALVEAAARAGATVRIGTPLFSDALGPEGTPEGTYAGMIEHNTRAIVQALGGTPLPRPAIAPLR